MQRGGSIKTSILQSLPPQTTVQCAGPISAQLLLGGRCGWDSSYNVNKKKKSLFVVEHKSAAETCVLTAGNIAES